MKCEITCKHIPKEDVVRFWLEESSPGVVCVMSQVNDEKEQFEAILFVTDMTKRWGADSESSGNKPNFKLRK